MDQEEENKKKGKKRNFVSTNIRTPGVEPIPHLNVDHSLKNVGVRRALLRPSSCPCFLAG
jgi:hypothetical protein